ncbi:MAG: histidine kinase dimerization/phospho-acceptor domain-containing protein [Archangium sp.]|nr:histidine kinase dimerization/phospho-acceptor domain-containing protein [Archangium sp.]
MTTVSPSPPVAPPPAANPDEGAERARRRSIFRWGGLIILGATAVPLLTGGDPLPTVAAHALWAAWVVAVGELLSRGVLGLDRAGLASTAGGMIFLPAIILASGQTGAVFYLLLVCLPLIIASMAPTDQPSVLLSGVGGLGWIVGLEVHAHHGVGVIAGWGLFSVLCTSIAGWATVLHRRSEAERKRAETERFAALARLAERERKEARTERLALLGQLAASIAHEVNNPLSYVTANLTYLRRLLDQPPPQPPDDRHEVFDETTEGLARISNTIRMLQLFVQPNGGPLTGHVGDAMGEALALSSGRLRKLTVPKTTVPAELPSVAMGHRRLVQLLVNLILNAVDAIEGTASPAISLTAAREREGVRLVVEDSGRSVGLARRVTPSEFQVGTPRAGLGVELCREHAEEAGGTLHVEAPAEGGNRVIIFLPAASPFPAPRESA